MKYIINYQIANYLYAHLKKSIPIKYTWALMEIINDVHLQFAVYFKNNTLKPFIYLLSKKLSEGHICLPLTNIQNEATLLPGNLAIAAGDIGELKNISLVSFNPIEKQPFVVHNNKMYIQRYFNYETIILERIKEFLKNEKNLEQERIDLLKKNKPFIQQLFSIPTPDVKGKPEPDWQLAATITSVLNDLSIISGGPGTGKTTTVAKILALLYSINPEIKVALTAPTGKAAMRMAESLKNTTLPIDAVITEKLKQLVPSTLHRLLKSTSNSSQFRHNKNNPVNFDLVIVDESSMMDVAIFAKLLDAIGPATRLILLGDRNQLASVDAGSLYGDLCQAQSALNYFSPERIETINSFTNDNSQKITADHAATSTHPLFQHIVELRRSHRFNDEKGIGRFSKAVINNDVESLQSFFERDADNEVMIYEQFDEEIFTGFIEEYKDFITETDISTALKKLNNLRVLCATREGDHGLYAVNKIIEDILIKRKLIRRTGEFYEYRPLIVTGNNYELGLFNGDIGIIRKNEKGIMMAWFQDSEGKTRPVIPGLINNVETVFAMTIHKSQGSEFDKVMVVLPNHEDNKILTRELLYTAVTRAREQVIIMAPERVILKTCKERVQRSSGIIDRFTIE